MDPATAAHFAKIGQATIIFATCLASILWYDTLATIPREFKIVWIPLFKKHFSKQKSLDRSPTTPLSWLSMLLFFTVRYVCNIQFILIIWSLWTVWTPEECDKFFYVDSYFSAFVTTAATGIMSLRLSAIWSRNLKIDIFLLLCWITLVAFMFWGSYFIEPVQGVPYCIAKQVDNNKNLLALYIGPLIFDTLVLILTLTRAVQLNHGNMGSILKALVVDGVLYFLGTFTVNLLATVFELQNLDPALKPLFASCATIGTSIFSSRIFFRMRELAAPASRNYSGGAAIPPTFADGTSSEPNSQYKDQIKSNESKGSFVTKSWNEVSKATVAAFPYKSRRTEVVKKEKAGILGRVSPMGIIGKDRGHERRLTDNSIHNVVKMETQLECVAVEMEELDGLGNGSRSSHDKIARTSSLGHSKKGRFGKEVESDEDQDENVTQSYPLAQVLSNDSDRKRTSDSENVNNLSLQDQMGDPRFSISSNQEVVSELNPTQVESNSTTSDEPYQVNATPPAFLSSNPSAWKPQGNKYRSLKRLPSPAEPAPFARQPSRDGSFKSFGADSNASETSIRGPKLTVVGKL